MAQRRAKPSPHTIPQNTIAPWQMISSRHVDQPRHVTPNNLTRPRNADHLTMPRRKHAPRHLQIQPCHHPERALLIYVIASTYSQKIVAFYPPLYISVLATSLPSLPIFQFVFSSFFHDFLSSRSLKISFLAFVFSSSYDPRCFLLCSWRPF